MHHVLLKISYSESTYPITPVEPLKARFWDNSEIYNNKFTYDKFKSAKFGFIILDMF